MSHEHADTCCHGHGHGHDHGHRHAPRPAVAAIGTLAGNAELRWSDLRIEAMDCPTEERLIRDALGRQPAVESLEFNLMQRLLRVQHRFDSVEPLQKLIAGLGMQAVPLDAGENTDGHSQAPAKPWWPLALAGAMALASEIVEWFGLAPDWVVAGLALLAILGAGLPTYRKGWIALKNRNLNINALMSIAVTGAVLIGQWPEAAMVSVLFAIAELIEAKSLDRARNAIRGLLQLAPERTLARIIHAVEEAQGSRAPTQRFVDSFARVYTPVVFLIALATAVLPPLLFGGAWLDWIYRALVLLVIACPCALVISTPVTIVSGLSAAARLGILIKGGVFLELGRKLSWVALDKTGTITHGKPQQTDYLPIAEADGTDARLLAASLAARSDHPVSRAVANAAEEDGLALGVVEDLAALPGRGVSGRIDGVLYHLGNHRLVEELGLCSPALEERLDALERQGKTVIALCDPQRVRALFAVADGVKDSSREAIRELHALDVKTLMLTGDNPHTAAAIAAQVGIDAARGNLLPEDKLREVEARQADGSRVGMVGDGINDAPALARADIGFAMGAAGTDTAIETAGVALMDDDLRKLPQFVRLSRTTHAILVQNITLALGIKAVFLALTLAGEGTLWMAVFADMGASLLVVFNGLRLLRKRF